MNGQKIQRLVPRSFFVTSGVGIDSEQAVAFDLALCDAGISECNLVAVSSILPARAEEVARSDVTLTPGEITHCVISRAEGMSGEVIGAGIGYGWLGAEGRFGIICEHHGHYTREYLMEKLKEKLHKMAETRISDIEIKIDRMKLEMRSVEVEDGKFGSVVVALVFVL